MKRSTEDATETVDWHGAVFEFRLRWDGGGIGQSGQWETDGLVGSQIDDHDEWLEFAGGDAPDDYADDPDLQEHVLRHVSGDGWEPSYDG